MKYFSNEYISAHKEYFDMILLDAGIQIAYSLCVYAVIAAINHYLL
jgi:hypothetical protein